jgi:carboxyl-terminal processing protease
VQKILRGVIALSTMIAAVGLVGRFLWRNSQGNLPILFNPPNSLAQSWNEAQLSEKDLEDIIQDESCRSSQKYFLSCVNAVHSIAAKLQMRLLLNGSLIRAPEPILASTAQDGRTTGLEAFTEKVELEPWRSFYISDPVAAKNISFQQILKNLKAELLENPERSQERAFMIATGLNAFLSVFKDPHTYLIPIKYYNEAIAPLSSFSNSLGVVLARGKGDYFIRKVLDKSPADLTGLRKGDFILEINHFEISNLALASVGELLKAKEGDTTHLVVRRNNVIKTFQVQRVTIEVPTITWKVYPNKRLGVLTLNKFAKGSCEKTQEALLEFSQAQTRAILFDLRDNGGGQLEEASCIASLFLGKDRVILKLHYQDSEKNVESIFGSHEQIYFGALGVLVNSGTASAAEILAGSLQEYHRAVLVGERTFGKGSFQEGEIWDSNPRIAFFETKGLFSMPSGRTPQLGGIRPDVVVRFRESTSLREEDLYINPLKPPSDMMEPMRFANRRGAYKCLKSSQEFSLLGLPKSSSEYDSQLEAATQLVICTAVAQNLNGF